MAEFVPSSRQIAGSEYGGVEDTTTGIQPKKPESLTNTEKLRLAYLTGQDTDTEALIDRRAMMGLSTEGRPDWLGGTGKTSQAELEGLVE